MTGPYLKASEIEEEIGTVEANLRVLLEEAAAASGVATEELVAEQIAEQQADLVRLRQLRSNLLEGSN